jgi:ribose 5-phosphate isomerase B
MIISIGSDHAGYDLKNKVIDYLTKRSFVVKDVGTYNKDPCDYPDFASTVCANITDKTSEMGILICGTGIGMSISANRFNNIRAALCVSEYMAKKSRQHNDANILVMGAKIIDEETAIKIIEEFLNQDFEGGRHISRIDKIS